MNDFHKAQTHFTEDYYCQQKMEDEMNGILSIP
jgi:hypothetical protein